MDLETQLAKASQTEVERRDPEMFITACRNRPEDSGPQLPLGRLFHRGGPGRQRRRECDRPGLLQRDGADDCRQPQWPDWKIYLRWHLINACGPRSLHAVCG